MASQTAAHTGEAGGGRDGTPPRRVGKEDLADTEHDREQGR
jgi:hypothetical protein